MKTKEKAVNVVIYGEIDDYNIQLYNERLARVLLKELGNESCEKLLKMLKYEK